MGKCKCGNIVVAVGIRNRKDEIGVGKRGCRIWRFSEGVER